jgi:hypothetical protein
LRLNAQVAGTQVAPPAGNELAVGECGVVGDAADEEPQVVGADVGAEAASLVVLFAVWG